MNSRKGSFPNGFRSHWIKVKFYEKKPGVAFKKLKNTRFCEATRKAVLHPVLLDKESVSCPGARHAFGWGSLFKNNLFKRCRDKNYIKENNLRKMVSQAPVLKKPFRYIGLNTTDSPDLVISYVTPDTVMSLLKRYHDKTGENMDVSLGTVMSVCGGVAVRTYLEDSVNLSFGCDDSRKFADMRNENVSVGIPKKMFSIFFD